MVHTTGKRLGSEGQAEGRKRAAEEEETEKFGDGEAERSGEKRLHMSKNISFLLFNPCLVSFVLPS